MRRLFASLLVAACGFAAVPARATCPNDCPSGGTWVPSFGQSSIPSFIRVGGFGGDGTLDPIGEFTLLIRDLANNPVAGAIVRVDFSACLPAEVCAFTATTCHEFDVPNHSVVAITDANGVVSMRVAGTANNPGGGPSFGDGRARLFACGVLLGTVPVAFFDMDGGDGVGAGDLSAWLGDFVAVSASLRGDYDGSGALGANDLSAWLTQAGTGRSALGCTNHP